MFKNVEINIEYNRYTGVHKGEPLIDLHEIYSKMEKNVELLKYLYHSINTIRYIYEREPHIRLYNEFIKKHPFITNYDGIDTRNALLSCFPFTKNQIKRIILRKDIESHILKNIDKKHAIDLFNITYYY
jgi:hypothetical protein